MIHLMRLNVTGVVYRAQCAPELHILHSSNSPPPSLGKPFDLGAAVEFYLFLTGGLLASVRFSKPPHLTLFSEIPESASHCFVNPCQQARSAKREGSSKEHQLAGLSPRQWP